MYVCVCVGGETGRTHSISFEERTPRHNGERLHYTMYLAGQIQFIQDLPLRREGGKESVACNHGGVGQSPPPA